MATKTALLLRVNHLCHYPGSTRAHLTRPTTGTTPAANKLLNVRKTSELNSINLNLKAVRPLALARDTSYPEPTRSRLSREVTVKNSTNGAAACQCVDSLSLVY